MRAEVVGIEGLDRAVDVVVCFNGAVIDVCLNERRTLAERCFDGRGAHLGLFAQAGAAHIEGLTVSSLL